LEPVAIPETRYARSGDVSIAYQVVGGGANDIVFIPGFISNLELGWQEPRWAAFYSELSKLGRLILLDKRGTGLSDRVGSIPPLETRMDDVRAVMDAAGSERAALFGISEGGPMTVLFAATHPSRTTAIVLYGTISPSRAWSADMGLVASREERLREIDEETGYWGTPAQAEEDVRWLAPSLADDEEFKRWWGTVSRVSASPGAIKALSLMNLEIDVRSVLPAVRTPTLIIHRTGDVLPIESARYMARRIPGARFVELEGNDHAFFVDSEPILNATRAFLTEVWEDAALQEAAADRILTTVLFTDIVDSTSHALERGDSAWRDLLAAHHAAVRRQLVRFRGSEVDTAGDGFFATFDGPARAIRSALAIGNDVAALGLQIRVGLHTGECELIDGKVGGVAVHIGARIAALAEPDEVLVSGTVKDLVAGSGIRFEPRGHRELKGLGEWPVYAVVRPDERGFGA
jgi:pimeloyl-ACP methyl ester carboxylesterase/class 3 adenylate cyclase